MPRIYPAVLLALITLLFPTEIPCAERAVYSGQSKGHTEIALQYDAVRANTVPGYNFWMHGGSMQVYQQVAPHWGAVADVSGLHVGLMPQTSTGLDIVSAVFGPRYTLNPRKSSYRFYGQALGGYARGFNSRFVSSTKVTSSANGAAVLLGGGVDYLLNRHLNYRILDANWLHTQLANGTTGSQNDLRVGAGLFFTFR